jgi:hypothetical protein
LNVENNTIQTYSELRNYRELISVEGSSRVFSKLATDELQKCLEDEMSNEEKYAKATKTLQELFRMMNDKNLSGNLSISKRAITGLLNLAMEMKNHREMFQILIECNIDITSATFSRLRNQLRKGSLRDRQLYECSQMFDVEDSQMAKLKFITVYSFNMINQIVLQYVKMGDPIKANSYLELLLSKHQLNQQMNKSTPDEEAQLYETISYLTIRHGHYKATVQIIKQMKENNVVLSPRLFTIFIVSLRQKKQYNAILVILRRIPELFKDVPSRTKSILINELLRLIRDKFPEESKVFLAHFVEIYPKWSEALNDLGLMGMVYLRTVKRLPVGHEVSQAAVNSFYRLETPSNENITELYASVLNHMRYHETDTAVNLGLLFKRYMSYLVNNPRGPFRHHKLDSGVLELFIKNAITIRQPRLAFYMLKSYLSCAPNAKFDTELITYVFHHHGMTKDQNRFDEITKLMAKYHVPVDFNMLSALVLKDQDNCKFWYDKLIEMGYRVQLQRLRDKAMREGWDLEPAEPPKDPWGEPWADEDDEEFVEQLESALEELCT